MIVMWAFLVSVYVLLIVGCAGSEGSSSAESDMPATRTVCVAEDSPDLAPYVQRGVDAWNDADTAPLSETCTEHVRCLPKVIAHELGHALGILWHTETGIMQPEGHRSAVKGLTHADLGELPDDAPALLFVDSAPCDHVVGWGYPSEPVLATEVAWYELKTGRVWIDPGVIWRD